MNRREFTVGAGLTAVAAMSGPQALADDPQMFGVIDQLITHEGRRDELISILLEGTRDLPGCLSYVISKDLENEDALWITEVWESQVKHRDSIRLPAVQKIMAAGKPLIADFGERVEMQPVGGHGLRT